MRSEIDFESLATPIAVEQLCCFIRLTYLKSVGSSIKAKRWRNKTGTQGSRGQRQNKISFQSSNRRP